MLLTHAGDGSGLVYVVEQAGVIHRLDPAEPERSEIFLDIRARVSRDRNEEGLLGLAFAPSFGENGRFYVYYSAAAPRRSVLSRFEVGGGGQGDADSEAVILEVDQPYSNHNGGMIAFGPDGMLYVALGDGGSGGDPQGNGQNLGTLLGSILRIDVGQGAPYVTPADNPFVGRPGARGEIWAYGLRNPWRFSFDRETGELWTGDVGQDAVEEVNIVRRGANYGWNVMEGSSCFRAASCEAGGMEAPVAEYGHRLGCSVTGGYVYRGERLPELQGVYLYADFCTGFIGGLRHDGERVTEQGQIAEAPFQIASFGEDEAGEVYILGFDGGVYSFAPSPGQAPSTPTPTLMPTPTSAPISGQAPPTPAPSLAPTPTSAPTSGLATPSDEPPLTPTSASPTRASAVTPTPTPSAAPPVLAPVPASNAFAWVLVMVVVAAGLVVGVVVYVVRRFGGLSRR